MLGREPASRIVLAHGRIQYHFYSIIRLSAPSFFDQVKIIPFAEGLDEGPSGTSGTETDA
ncbi:MAG: hypothetical protein WCB27_05710 [Thermoguttaceae bacterium]|jgi:hypothetical protein